MANKKRVLVEVVREGAVIPKYARKGDAGFDLISMVDVVIQPGETVIIPLGLKFALPEGYEIQVRPRSGSSYKTKLRVANSPGTVDTGYRGEVGVILENTRRLREEGTTARLTGVDGKPAELPGFFYPRGSYLIRKGDRVAQGVLAEYTEASFDEVDELDATERGEGGFGSTGV